MQKVLKLFFFCGRKFRRISGWCTLSRRLAGQSVERTMMSTLWSVHADSRTHSTSSLITLCFVFHLIPWNVQLYPSNVSKSETAIYRTIYSGVFRWYCHRFCKDEQERYTDETTTFRVQIWTNFKHSWDNPKIYSLQNTTDSCTYILKCGYTPNSKALQTADIYLNLMIRSFIQFKRCNR